MNFKEEIESSNHVYLRFFPIPSSFTVIPEVKVSDNMTVATDNSVTYLPIGGKIWT